MNDSGMGDKLSGLGLFSQTAAKRNKIKYDKEWL